MNRPRWIGLLVAVLVWSTVQAGGEIYGTITTQRGDTLTGPIRWDHNENFWDDILDASKGRTVREDDEGFQLSLFGWDITSFGKSESYAPLSMPFGHIRSIEATWDGGGKITLRSGEVIEARPSGDLGDSVRSIVIVDAEQGKVELEWDDVQRVDFEPGRGAGRDDERLYGKVFAGEETFTGFITWDRDKSLGEDVLDGYQDRREEREIPFAEIREIEKLDSRGCRITLADGSRLVLDGTNDVDSGNRGIDVTVPGVGRIQLGWREFDRVVFMDPPPSAGYAKFDGGRWLHGTLTTREGAAVSGRDRLGPRRGVHLGAPGRRERGGGLRRPVPEHPLDPAERSQRR